MPGHHHPHGHHSHGPAPKLDEKAAAVVARGVAELLALTEGLSFRPLNSGRFPHPLAQAFHGSLPDLPGLRERARSRAETDPVAALEDVLVLLELYEANQPGVEGALFDDDSFLGRVFGTKRMNAWTAVLGGADPEKVIASVNARWQFRLLRGREPRRTAALYPLLNAVARYAFVYGRVRPGDDHELGHFIEDFAPAVLVCAGEMDDLERTISLAAMKMGVPAVVPPDYPFRLGRQARLPVCAAPQSTMPDGCGQARAESLEAVAEVMAAFPNIRKLLDMPGIPELPGYLDPRAAREEFEPAKTWGDTPESFYIFRKGGVERPGVTVSGSPAGPMGVVLTADAEPLDAFDRFHIEGAAVPVLSMMKGVQARASAGRLVLALAPGVAPDPERIGETLIAAIRREFPKIERLSARVEFDPAVLSREAGGIRDEIESRWREIERATEENVSEFVACVGCSPFAPDHVCLLTPERPPQCGRSYMGNLAGARYGYDDMTNIHHRVLHAGINSFQVCRKGTPVDPVAGEWSGLNECASRLTGGRTTRVKLHSLEGFPHTGCGCFGIILFKTDRPRPGIGIMERGYGGKTPDGRTWGDLHYAQAGKQTPGQTGASAAYLKSPKFLAGDGGWKNVVWVTPRIAETMGSQLPAGIKIGE